MDEGRKKGMMQIQDAANEFYEVVEKYNLSILELEYVENLVREQIKKSYRPAEEDVEVVIEKSAYGKLKNVYLTEKEYKCFCDEYVNAEHLIDLLSQCKQDTGIAFEHDYIVLKRYGREEGE